MGRQIGFYTLDEDVKRFLNYVSLTGRVTIIRGQNYPSPNPIEIDFEEFPSVASQNDETDFYLWNRAIPGSPVVQLVTPYDKSKASFYALKASDSPVIEFQRCMLKDSILTKGRLWMETTILVGNESLQKKPDAFIRWYESLTKWFQKNLHKVSDRWGHKVFISESVLDWTAAGGSLENVDPDQLHSIRSKSLTKG